MSSKPPYRAYLLRLRQSGHREMNSHTWRISLQEAGTQHETFFATVDALMIYLTAQLQMGTVTHQEMANPDE